MSEAGCVSLGRSLRHRLQTDAFQFPGDRVVDLARRAGFRRGDQVQQFVASFVLVLGFGNERSSPGQQFVEDHAQAEDVGSPINAVPFAPGLLGTHVGGRSSDPAPLPKSSSLSASPKSATNALARSVDQNVGGLDVPVDQARAYERDAGIGDRCHQSRRLMKAEAYFLDPARQGRFRR